MGLVDEFVRLEMTVNRLKQRSARGFRFGKVHKVDVEKKRVQLNFAAEGEEPFLSPPIPYAQVAGARKRHEPPSEGQQMAYAEQSGGVSSMGLAFPLTWSNENPSPGDSEDEHVETFGDLKIVTKPTGFELYLGADTYFKLTPDGIEAKGKKDIKLESENLTHNDKNISDTHVHTEVVKGGALSGPPAP